MFSFVAVVVFVEESVPLSEDVFSRVSKVSTSSSSEQSSGNSGSENETVKRSGRSGGRIGAEIMEEYGKNMATLSSVILDDVAPLFLAIY